MQFSFQAIHKLKYKKVVGIYISFDITRLILYFDLYLYSAYAAHYVYLIHELGVLCLLSCLVVKQLWISRRTAGVSS